jgi:cyclophilin family peptidyl-prolyl cis-trans isomerase
VERNLVLVTALAVLLLIAVVASVWALVESGSRDTASASVNPVAATRQAATARAGATAAARPTTAATRAIPTPTRTTEGDQTVKTTPLQWSSEPAMTIDKAKQYFAVFKTVKGDFRVELFASKVPHTVNNFVFLARQHFYDGTTFHRVIAGFMAQGGDPTGAGTGGPGYKFADEFDPSLKHDSEGILSMANSGVNTNGSQFFITYAPQPHLDGKHSVFGKVVSGMDVLKSLTPRDPAQNGPAGDKIITITIEEK